MAVYVGGNFGNDQYAAMTISALAPYETVINITAVAANTPSAGLATLTYTVTSGEAVKVPQYFYITGMSDAENNSVPGYSAFFQVINTGVGTIIISNASAVNASGQSGTGISPSDSVAGLALRGTPDGRNAYVFFTGSNSYNAGTNPRVYCREDWKYVNGAGTFFAGDGVIGGGTNYNYLDAPGDKYIFTVIGTHGNIYKNGFLWSSFTDSSLTSGIPGIWSWGIDGPYQQNWWVGTQAPGFVLGNPGTQMTDFIAGTVSATNTGAAVNSFVQENSFYAGYPGHGTSPVTLGFNSSNAKGNLLFAVINWVDATPGTVAVTDSNGNTGWTALPVYHANQSSNSAAFYCLNCKAGANTVSFNFTGGTQPTNSTQYAIAEYHGPNVFESFGNSASTYSESTGLFTDTYTVTPTSCPVLVTHKNSLVLAWSSVAYPATQTWSSTVGGIWTIRTTNTAAGMCIADQLNMNENVYSAALTRSSTPLEYTAAFAASFYESAGANPVFLFIR